MKNVPLLIGTIVGTVALIVGVAFFFSSQSPQQAGLQAVDPIVAAGDARHTKGATESAKVTVVEFSDFQCPACKAAEPAVRSLIAQYPNDVRFVYRHFPLDQIHPNARDAAYAAEAASDFGKFWEMHEQLFASQSDWGSITSRDELKEYFATMAEELEIDKAAFLEKIEDQAVRERVTGDVASANQIGVSATPTFYVDGQQVSAPQLLSTVETLVTTTNASE